MRRLTLAFGMVALAAVLAACSRLGRRADRRPGGDPATAGGDVSIVAKDIKFQQPQVAVKAGEPLAVGLRQPGRRAAQHRDLRRRRRRRLQG